MRSSVDEYLAQLRTFCSAETGRVDTVCTLPQQLLQLQLHLYRLGAFSTFVDRPMHGSHRWRFLQPVFSFGLPMEQWPPRGIQSRHARFREAVGCEAH